MNGKELARSLREGDYVYGTAILSTSSIWAKAVESLGLDFVFIDTEHTPLDRERVSWMCQLYRALDLAPLVRIPSPDHYYQASMMLDGGAIGIIAPYIETAEQVRRLVGAVKHKPVKGNKLQNKIYENKQFEPDLYDYIRQKNEENVLVVNIESIAALEALSEILSIEGLDAVLVGPHDLSCSMGIPEQYHHPSFKQSVETVIEQARDRGVGVGVHIWDDVGFDQEIIWAKKGANLIMHSSDILVFRRSMQNDIKRIKEALGSKRGNKYTTSFNI